MLNFIKAMLGIKPDVIDENPSSPYIRVSLENLSMGDVLPSGDTVKTIVKHYSSYNIYTDSGLSHWVAKGHYVTIKRR